MSEEFEDRLRRSLRTVAGSTVVPPRPELVPRRAPRSGWRVLAIAAAIVAILGVIAVAQLAGGLQRSLPALHGPGREEPFPEVSKLVSLDRPQDAKSELEGTFGALGLDVTMRFEPVPPAQAGRVLGVEGGIEVDDDECVEGVPDYRIRVIAPAGFEGHGVVTVGIDDPDGFLADPERAADAFATGQPLHCRPELLGARLEDVERRLDDLGLQYRSEFGGTTTGTGTPDRVAGARVTRRNVVILVTEFRFEPTAGRVKEVDARC